MLLQLYDAILVSIIENWLLDCDIVRLDSAFCSNLQRPWFLSLLTKSAIVYEKSRCIHKPCRIEWIASRQMRWKIIALASRIPAYFLTTIPSTLNLVRLEASVSIIQVIVRERTCRVKQLIVVPEQKEIRITNDGYFSSIGKITSLESIDLSYLNISKECALHLAQNNPSVRKVFIVHTLILLASTCCSTDVRSCSI